MPEYLAPGVYVEEVPSAIKVIEGAGTSTCGFVGVARRGPINQATLITSQSEFYAVFGRPIDIRQRYYLGHAVECFFREGGSRCYVVRVAHYTDILDPDTVAAATARTSLANKSSSDVLEVTASSPGAWGRNLRVMVANTSKLATTLSAELADGVAVDRITVASTEGIEPGSMLWIVQPVFATVTYEGGVLHINEEIYREGSPTRLDPGPIADNGATVITPDFRYKAALSADLELVAGANPVPTLNNVLTDAAAANHDINGKPLAEGETLWIIDPTAQVLRIVQRVEGQQVIFTADLTPDQVFAANTRVMSRDFKLTVASEIAGRLEVVEVFENLSLVAACQTDFADTRINSASRHIEVSVTPGTDPIENAALGELEFDPASTDPDGLNGLSQDDYIGSPASATGISAFDAVDDVNTLVVPFPRCNHTTETGELQDATLAVYGALCGYCEGRKYLFCVLDSQPGLTPTAALAFKNLITASNYGAYYYPWIRVTPAGQTKSEVVPPSGAIAGIFAHTDQKRGVHKAPAGTSDGRVKSAGGIERKISKAEQDGLNNQGVNVLRAFPASGLNVWGARTIAADPAWKYVNVRRLMSFIELSIDRGTQWVVFEPNNLALWKNIERNVAAFLRGVWRSGALFGETAGQAFQVKCDAETNTSETIELGRVITEIAVAPVKPAEFVIFRIAQHAAGSTLTE